jgi:hypothetical protein
MASVRKELPRDELWEGSIEDLLAAPAQTPAPATDGRGPYIINLLTAVEPIRIPSVSLIDFAQLSLYQVTGWKNDRLLFRLRLGPIQSALEADAILGCVRRDYPEAETLAAGEDDFRMIAAVAAIGVARERPMPAAASPPAPSSASVPPVAQGLGEIAAEIVLDTPAAAPIKERAPAKPAPIASGWTTAPPRQPPKPARAAPAGSVQDRHAATIVIPPSPSPSAAEPVLPPGTALARQFEVMAGTLVSVDSTQTPRALSLPERANQHGANLYAIELARSPKDIAPDSVPNLAIFNEYRLYSAVELEGTEIVHVLRLGFFRDEPPAAAVAAYLRSYFEAAAVTRVSAAERERFADRRMTARKAAGEAEAHAAIDLSSGPAVPTTSLADLYARTARHHAATLDKRRTRSEPR